MMCDETFVSVIVLTYNHAKYIRQALDSILMQEVDFSYEVLVGDDGSTDGTRDILHEYAAQHPEHIRLFLREKNLGAARNAYELLCASNGKYLAFCEGDDYWTHPKKLSQQVSFLENNPDFVGCTHRFVLVDENSKKKEQQKLLWVREKERFTLADFKGIYLPGQTATIVKRNLFRGKTDPYPFLYTLNKNISDRTSTLLYLTKGPFGLIPEEMSAYRQVQNAGITNHIYQDNSKRIQHELEYTRQLEALAGTLTAQTGIFDDYYQQLYGWAAWQHIKHPTAHSKVLVKETAKHIGKGVIHPIAFILGILKKTGRLK